MAVDEAVLDYDPIGEFEQEDRRMLRMLLVAAQRGMVDSSSQAVPAPSSSPWVSTWSRSPWCARSAPPAWAWTSRTRAKKPSSTSAPTSRTSWCTPGDPRFVRILPCGGRDITLAIARAAGVEDDVAERLKRGEEIEQPERRRGPAPARSRRDRACAARAAASRAFVDEIRSSLEFYTAQLAEARIARVLMTGGGSKLDGFIDLLRQRIPVQVDPGQVFQRVRSQLADPRRHSPRRSRCSPCRSVSRSRGGS